MNETIVIDCNGSVTTLVDVLSSSEDDPLTPLQREFFRAYFILVICVGSVSNLGILAAIFRSEKLHSAAYALIANLALADFLVCTVLVSLNWIIFGNKVTAELYYSVCVAESVVSIMIEFASRLSVFAVAINRCATICNLRMQIWFTRSSVTKLIAAIWLISFLVSMTIFVLNFIQSKLIQRTNSLVCAPPESTMYILYLFTIVIPLLSTFVCYLKIYLFLRRQRARVTPVVLVTSASNKTVQLVQLTSNRSDDSRVLRSIVAVSVLYGVCTGLHLSLRFIAPQLTDSMYRRKLIMSSWCALFASNWANVFIYLVWNPTFRRALLSYRKRRQSVSSTAFSPSSTAHPV